MNNYNPSGDRIVIPLSELVDALDDRSKITLIVSGKVLSGYIKFLPTEESEDYSLTGYIFETDGRFISDQYWLATDFIDVQDVVDIVITTSTRANAAPLYGYDADKRSVRLILPVGEYDNRHVVPDGSYRYVRSCGSKGSPQELKLYFIN